MNLFERKAKEYRRKNNPSWPHEIETYTNGNKVDWFLVGSAAFLIGFGIVALIVLL